MKRKFALSLVLLAGMFATTFTSCKKDDDDDEKETTVETLKASFTYEGNHRPTPGIVKFTNTSKLATSYHWDFGDGTTSEEENPEHQYQAAGQYEVVLTATASDGSTDEKKSTVKMLGACTKVKLEDIFIYKEAITDGDATEWDTDGTSADVTFKIFNSNNEEIFYIGGYFSDVTFDEINTAVTFTNEEFEILPFELTSLTETYKIVVYDYDDAKGSLEQICEAPFKPQDFIPAGELDPYPNMFEIDSPHIAMNISWAE